MVSDPSTEASADVRSSGHIHWYPRPLSGLQRSYGYVTLERVQCALVIMSWLPSERQSCAERVFRTVDAGDSLGTAESAPAESNQTFMLTLLHMSYRYWLP